MIATLWNQLDTGSLLGEGAGKGQVASNKCFVLGPQVSGECRLPSALSETKKVRKTKHEPVLGQCGVVTAAECNAHFFPFNTHTFAVNPCTSHHFD